MKRGLTELTLAVGTVALALALPVLGQTEGAPEGVVATAAPATPLAPDAGATSWDAGPYTYDPSGNIIGIAGGSGQQTFRYDVNGRLVTSTITGPLGSTTEQFGYDVYANMLTHTVDGSTTSFPTTSPTNHLTSGINAAYDAAGNLTQWQPPGTAVVYRYSYDALHMMTESKATDPSNNAYAGAHRVMHVYTADDERIWTYDLTAGVSQWRLRGLDGKVLRDFAVDTSWHLTRDYVYRDGALLAAITPSGSEHYTLDHLGTPRLITDGSGYKIGAVRTYRPFGQEWATASPVAGASALQFTGHERDADAIAGGSNGLDYLHARFYSPQMGRFLSVDPADGVSNVPQSWNRYAYVENNPMLFTDPTGMSIFTWLRDLFRLEDSITVHSFTIDVPTYDDNVAEWNAINRQLDRQQMQIAARDRRERERDEKERQRVSNCYTEHKFSSLFGGGTASDVVGFLEVGADFSFGADLLATAAKASRAGVGGPKQAYASGMNAAFRAIGRAAGSPRLTGALRGVGDRATPALAIFAVGTLAYNASTMVQCRAGVLE